MKISKLAIKRFRGIRECELNFDGDAVLIGDNNVGKSTVLEAINLVLGPDRLRSNPVINEHDFYAGEYQECEDGKPNEIMIEVTLTDLNDEQRPRFMNEVEWWDRSTKTFVSFIESMDSDSVEASLRVTFLGQYDAVEDDFSGRTYFTRSLIDEDTPRSFTKMDKRFCGFLYLRSLRTARRALSLEHGSLLDIILRLKEMRPQMWKKTIDQARQWNVAEDPELGISGILESIEKAMRKYVPQEWGIKPQLRYQT
ncbi:MAG: AAA family ATPase [Bacteroidetes bacterium]|nr:AAA family ATPase [Bacteroidota bacterium]